MVSSESSTLSSSPTSLSVLSKGSSLLEMTGKSTVELVSEVEVMRDVYLKRQAR